MNQYLKTTLIALLLFWLLGCQQDTETKSSSNESPRIKNSSEMVSPKNNSTFALGASIPFEITSTKDIDSIVVEYLDKQTTFLEETFEWESENMRTGNQRVKVTVFHGEENESHYPRFKFLSDTKPEQYTYKILETYPHNKESFTQGLFFKGDTLYESTGLRGSSRLLKVNYKTGKIYQSHALADEYFGEGITYWGDNLYLLTYTSKTGFIYDFSFNETGAFRYAFQEGWGLTTMGDTIIASDGTEVLHFLNPNGLSEFDKLEVYTDEDKVINLNEMELINGEIYANIWQEDIIVVIDPKTGKILKEIDMSGILSETEKANSEVLNGIAIHPESGRIFVTGKFWPKLFEVEFVKK